MESNVAAESKKSFSKEEKQQIIRHWEQSGQTKPVFAKEKGINYHTLVSWITPKRKKVKISSGEKPVKGFSQVNFGGDALIAFVRITTAHHKLELLQPVSADFLKTLLK